MTRESGFTLIEILVAVIVTSLLLLSVYGVFSTIDGARQRVERDTGHYHQARVIFDRLGREIHGVYLAANNRQSGFRGGTGRGGTPLSSNCRRPLPRRKAAGGASSSSATNCGPIRTMPASCCCCAANGRFSPRSSGRPTR